MKKKILLLLAGIFALVINIKAQGVPSVSIYSDKHTICPGDSIDFRDTSYNIPSSWTWYFPGGVPSKVVVNKYPGGPVPVYYYKAGTYYVTCVVKNRYGQDSVTEQNFVLVNPAASAVINPPYGGICGAGDTIYFKATGAKTNTYFWAPAQYLSCQACPNPKATLPQPPKNPLHDTVFTCIVTNSYGCSTTYYDTVVNNTITAKITGHDSICLGYKDTLTASGAANNVFSGTTYAWSNGKTTSQIIVSPAVATTYTCVINSGNCSAQDTLTVYPFPLPVYTITSPDSLCYPGTATITVAPSPKSNKSKYAYYWQGPFGQEDTNIFVTSPSTTTTYTLIVGNLGCFVDTLVPLKINTPPNIVFSGATNLCKNASTIIGAHVQYRFAQYHWSTGASTSSINVEPATSITYTLQVTTGQCIKDTSFTIIVDTMPIPKFKGDTSLCIGDTARIFVSGGYTYLWNTGSTQDSVTVDSITYGQTFFVTVTKGACSKDSAKIILKVYPHPKPAVSPIDTTFCQYDSLQLMATGGDYYIWSPKSSGLNHYIFYGDTDRNNAAPMVATTYRVKVCTWGCCKDTFITENLYPGAPGTVCCNTTVGAGTPVHLTATPGNVNTTVAFWSPSTGLSCSTCPNPTSTVSQTTTYTVTFVNAGCTTTDSVTVDIFNCNVFVPDVFSPNGDGINDVLYVRSLCIKKMDFNVFDRWGNKLFESKSLDDGWDGTYNGVKMPMGTYIWNLTGLLEDGTNISKTGNVTIVR